MKCRCGYCCTLCVRLHWTDILKIKLLGYTDFIIKDNSGKKCIKKKANEDCLFLERKGDKAICTIYEHRPRVCRQYDCKKPNVYWKSFLEN